MKGFYSKAQVGRGLREED